MDYRWRVLLIVLGVLLVVGVFHQVKPLPDGLSLRGEEVFVSESDVSILIDDTFMLGEEQVFSHEIFDEVFSLIAGSEEFVHVDMFLFNDYPPGEYHRSLTDELTASLLSSAASHRSLVTDPINTVYGGAGHEQLSLLEDGGVDVVVSDLSGLRDSNVFYSPLYRVFFSWVGNQRGGFLPSVLSEERVSLRSYLRLLNFKANHRKVVVADSGGELVSVVSSANPHDASSAHSNVAARIRSSAFAQQVVFSERPLVPSLPSPPSLGESSGGEVSAQLVTEGAIKEVVLEELGSVEAGDVVELGMFYLSDRDVIEALVGASLRGASVRVVLDPAKDAFGREKSGVPNRQAAWDLVRLSGGAVELRWFATQGEQFHSKFLAVTRVDGSSVLVLGSANYTRRNLDDYNLESNVVLRSSSDAAFVLTLREYFSSVWSNEGGLRTVDYSVYADESRWRYVLYRFQEATGLSTF